MGGSVGGGRVSSSVIVPGSSGIQGQLVGTVCLTESVTVDYISAYYHGLKKYKMASNLLVQYVHFICC